MVRFFCSHHPASKELFFVGDPEELTQERKCLLQWWFKNLLDKQVLWYREAPKHVFFFKQEQSSFGIVQLGQSLGSVFGRGMLTPRLFWMGQLGWTFSRFNHETDIPKVNGFRSGDETVVQGPVLLCQFMPSNSRLSAQKLSDYLVDCWSGTRSPEK